jgi:glycosyltransferase involved in cell wall biosynthesis
MQLFRVLQGYPGEKLMVMGWPPEKDAKLLPCRYETVKLLTYRLACTRFRHWVSGLNSLNTLWEPQLGRSERLAREFQPEVVVTVMDKLSYYKHAWALARRLKVPLITITMDDPETFETAVPPLRWAFQRFLKKMYGEAAVSIGVSQEMCDYLEREFGMKSEVFYFGAPDGIRPRDPEASRQLKKPGRLSIAYAGTFGLGYRDGLAAMIPTLEKVNARILLYTRDQHWLLDHPRIVNRGFHPIEKLWPLIQEEADVLVLPYAMEGLRTSVYRTHFPTKLSEYCWAGMPILAIGPEYATGYLWAKKHPEAAVTGASYRTEELEPILQTLKENGEVRVRLAQGAAEVAEREFDPERIQKRFVKLLAEAAGRN